MSDNLEWMNRHLVLLEYLTVKEAVEKEQYPASTDQLKLAEKFPDSEDFILQLEQQHEYKDACCFFAYNMHKRAAVWWGYLCVLDFLEEVLKNPPKPRDIEDIGKPKPFNIPQWARMPELPKVDTDKNLADFDNYFQKAMNQHHENLQKISPEMREMFEEGWDLFQQEIKKVHGKDLMELMHDVCVKYIKSGGRDFEIDLQNSPITKAVNEVREKIEKSRLETIKTIKASLPKVDIKAKHKMMLRALDGVYKYIASPDEDNAANCYIAGNKVPDTPEGMLALVAFWSFGDLDPLGANIVKTPAGLMSNGLNSLLLMLALSPGGVHKVDERYERYYKLGFAVASGKNNWSESIEEQHAPHEKHVSGIRSVLGEPEPVIKVKKESEENKFKINVDRFKLKPKNDKSL